MNPPTLSLQALLAVVLHLLEGKGFIVYPIIPPGIRIDSVMDM